ncbi:MAG TPA: transglycosylase domain-containing protein, partial [Smithellaceae bacterium]|nr:transglycosylase domain-containing protein [Smithellaceae bacterium]
MEELKQNPLFPGLNGFSQFWAHRISTVGGIVKKINLALRNHRRLILVIILILSGIAAVEIKTSFFEARFFTWLAGQLSFTVQPGPNDSLQFPADGPYDQRLGYTKLSGFIKNLGIQGYKIESQARPSAGLNAITSLGLNPAYREKNQAGLSIFDCDGEELFKARYPQRVCGRFESLSPLIVNTLLFIENRELLDSGYANRNPAVEWDRLAKALFDRGIHIFNPDHSFAGGSTLPTQIEKFRHSPEGRTTGAVEKLKQIISASLRSYRQGRDTQAVRRHLVVDYLNSVPFAAFPG